MWYLTRHRSFVIKSNLSCSLHVLFPVLKVLHPPFLQVPLPNGSLFAIVILSVLLYNIRLLSTILINVNGLKPNDNTVTWA